MKITSEFLNLQTDFGFKHLFGDERNKNILMRFLNALLGDKIHIKDVSFKNKEILPPNSDGKRIIYDVYCTSGLSGEDSGFLEGPLLDGDKSRVRDHHFILEMQNLYTPPFEERIFYYAAKMVSDQGKAGWNYDLEPVITIAVTDFNFRNLSDKMVRDIMLLDRDTSEVLTEKFHLFFVSLKEVPKVWEECKTDLEEILFLIKNMDKLDNNSIAYKEGRYKDMFEASRINSLREEEYIRYSDSLEKLRETQAGIKYEAMMASREARAKALEEGRAEGRAEGKAQGEKEEKLKTAKIMWSMGLPKDTIRAVTRLSDDELDEILK